MATTLIFASPTPDAASGRYDQDQERRDDFDKDDEDYSALGSDPGWRSVRGGLSLVRLGTLIQVCAAAAVLFLIFVMFFTGAALLAQAFNSRSSGRYQSGGAETGLAVMLLLFAGLAVVMIANLTGTVLRIVGFVKCLQVPEASGAKGLAIGALICECLPFAGYALIFMDAFAQSGLLGPMANLVNVGAMLGGLICLLLLLRQVGQLLQAPQLPNQVLNYVIWLAISIGVGVGMFCLNVVVMMAVGYSVASSRTGRSDFESIGMASIMMVVVWCLVLVTLGIIMVMKYVGLLNLAIEVIGRRSGGRRF